MKRQELIVSALDHGTVIDHIPCDRLFQVIRLLHIESMSNKVTIGYNLRSRKMGTKSIIKIADRFFSDDELSQLAVVAPNVTLSEIRDYELAAKKQVTLPSELRGIVKCDNPKCITNNEPMSTLFHVTPKAADTKHATVRCHYCEHEQDIADVELCGRQL